MRASIQRGEGPPHILVVDDEPEIRDLLRRVLAREGYEVTTRAEAAQALEDLRNEEFAVLISDLKMPRMGGLELLKAAKVVRPDLGSILITGYASTETAVKALRFGADDFITKPFAIDDLRRVVDRVLSERRMLTQERDALDLAREETEALRRRTRAAEEALQSARAEVTVSRHDLERRVCDLEFIHELTLLLQRTEDLQRMLETTARILTKRFEARVVRIEAVMDSGVYTAQHLTSQDGGPLLSALGDHLVQKARRDGDAVAREVFVAADRPFEAFAAPLDLPAGPSGGITMLRSSPAGDDPCDRSLFSLVPRALAVAIEAELRRRAAVRGALEVANGMLLTLEGRGTLFKGHADRVAFLAQAAARRLGLSQRLQEVIHTAARLHDVGEIGIPDEMLCREGPLTDAEREVVRQHPIVGARILAPFGEAAAFVRHHKERPDGQGYPDGLQDGEIPIGAALIGVAEAFDAMTHHRAWRPTRTRIEALDEIERLKGSQFVPEAADALLGLPYWSR